MSYNDLMTNTTDHDLPSLVIDTLVENDFMPADAADEHRLVRPGTANWIARFDGFRVENVSGDLLLASHRDGEVKLTWADRNGVIASEVTITGTPERILAALEALLA